MSRLHHRTLWLAVLIWALAPSNSQSENTVRPWDCDVMGSDHYFLDRFASHEGTVGVVEKDSECRAHSPDGWVEIDLAQQPAQVVVDFDIDLTELTISDREQLQVFQFVRLDGSPIASVWIRRLGLDDWVNLQWSDDQSNGTLRYLAKLRRGEQRLSVTWTATHPEVVGGLKLSLAGQVIAELSGLIMEDYSTPVRALVGLIGGDSGIEGELVFRPVGFSWRFAPASSLVP